jgi:hypothetical protein
VVNPPRARPRAARRREPLEQMRALVRRRVGQQSAGDFEKPLATHGEMPPGTPARRERREAIAYSYEKTRGGGRVRIATKDPAAVDAIHDFLRYQIREHDTGDPESVRR